MTELPKISHIRQEAIFNPANQRFKITIFGAGSLGSFICLNLAKLGFNDIKVIDYDIVEGYNLPNQFYRIQDINAFKIDALQSIVKDFADVQIETLNTIITKENITTYFPAPALNELFIMTFDNLHSRKIAYDSFRGMNNYFMDVRMGGQEFSIKTTLMSDKKDLEEHDKDFDITPTDIPCGEKSVIYSVLAISAEVCNIVKKLNEEQPYPKRLSRHMARNFFLTDLK